MQVTRLQSNAGFTGVPGAICADPIPASGQTLVDAAVGADHEATVVGGASYAVTADATGTMLMGILTTATAANIIWVCAPGETVVINVPESETTLHYQGTVNATTAYLRRIYRNPGAA